MVTNRVGIGMGAGRQPRQLATTSRTGEWLTPRARKKMYNLMIATRAGSFTGRPRDLCADLVGLEWLGSRAFSRELNYLGLLYVLDFF